MVGYAGYFHIEEFRCVWCSAISRGRMCVVFGQCVEWIGRKDEALKAEAAGLSDAVSVGVGYFKSL